ncbi:MAG: LpxI family protein [Opitutales bacterium]
MPPVSRFLPQDFDVTAPIVVIAGQRRYPVLLTERVRAAGLPLRLIAFESETPRDLIRAVPAADRVVLKVGQLGHMLDAVKRWGARYALMAGQISPRKLFRGLHPDFKAIRILASLKERNAETIFGAIAREMAAAGCELLDARSFLDDQLSDEGPMVAGRFTPDGDTLAHGIRIASACAELDIGQGVVVARGTVLAVEAFEGTDAMLRRAGEFGSGEALFVKTVKPVQDYRFDVPVFGEGTLGAMAAAGISAAALKAGDVIILDKATVLAEARRLKIALHGWTPESLV